MNENTFAEGPVKKGEFGNEYIPETQSVVFDEEILEG
jgi:hypothetical protein